MVKRFLKLFGKEIAGLHDAAYLLGIFALLSQILGFFRDRLLASEFGAGETLDVYYAAFRVPDFIFIVGASLVSLSVLIPFLSERMKEGREKTRELLDMLFTGFFSGMALISAMAFISAPALARLLFPGFGEHLLSETVGLMRIMLLQPIFLGISNLFASITQLERRFFIYAVSPILYNAGIIAGILFLYPAYGLGGLAWGVVLGAALHAAVQIPVLLQSGLFPRFTNSFRFRELASIVLVSLPRTLALSAQNLSVLALTALGSVFGAGSITIFNLSWNLQSVPLAIVGASYSLAAFPTLSLLWSGGNREKFLGTFSSAVRHILFWSFPALALFVVLRAQIVRTVLGAGAFDWTDTRLTAASLAVFAISVVAQSLTLLFTRAYYAAGKTRTPLAIGIGAATVTVLSAYGFYAIFSENSLSRFFLESLLRVGDIAGTSMLALPLAYSAGALLAAVAFWISFSRQFTRLGGTVWRTFWESFAASTIMGFSAYLFLNILDTVFNLSTALGIFLQGFFAGVGGIAVGIAVLLLLGNAEIREIWRTLHHRFWRAKFIGPDPTDTAF